METLFSKFLQRIKLGFHYISNTIKYFDYYNYIRFIKKWIILAVDDDLNLLKYGLIGPSLYCSTERNSIIFIFFHLGQKKFISTVNNLTVLAEASDLPETARIWQHCLLIRQFQLTQVISDSPKTLKAQFLSFKAFQIFFSIPKLPGEQY